MVDISKRVRLLAKSGGWVGVDLDGTLFTYDKWVSWSTFGEPIAPMMERVCAWLDAGVTVKIVTARVSTGASTCRVTGVAFDNEKMTVAIQDHLEKHGLPRLEVTCMKDVDMIELWDDRAVQVMPNTGKTVFEHAAEQLVYCGECDCPSLSRRKILASADHG